LAVDFDDRDALVVALAKNCVGVDIDEAWFLAVATKERECVVAEVTALAGI
jgi:hypothetical protein